MVAARDGHRGTRRRKARQAHLARSPRKRQPLVELLEDYVLLTGMFTVTNTMDLDAGGVAVTNSLRWAIQQAEALGGPSVIDFAITPAGTKTITLSAPPMGMTDNPLPDITVPVTIDGTTQSGFNPATPTPMIQIDGINADGSVGRVDHVRGLNLVAGAGGSVLRGLVVSNFSGDGIHIANVSGVLVAGDYAGTNLAGTAKASNNGTGLVLDNTSTSTVGGTTAADRDVLSGNHDGLGLIGVGATGDVVKGNYIGLAADGLTGLGNGGSGTGNGIFAFFGVSTTTIGGNAAGAGNVIAGNTADGIFMAGIGQSNNVIQGNTIGTNTTGTATNVGNGGRGIDLGDSDHTQILDNQIAGNGIEGINVSSSTVDNFGSDTLIQGNKIGTDPTGATALGNHTYGINLSSGHNTVTGNVISSNSWSGINISDAQAIDNVIQNNDIGVGADGTTALGNGNRGISVFDAAGNTLGGANVLNPNGTIKTRLGNIIGANHWEGIFLSGGANAFTLGVQNFDNGATPTSTAFFAAQAGEGPPFSDPINSSRTLSLTFHNVSPGSAASLTFGLYNVDNNGGNVVTGFRINGVAQGTAAFTAVPGSTVIVYTIPLTSAQVSSYSVKVELDVTVANPSSPAGIDFAQVNVGATTGEGFTVVEGNFIGVAGDGKTAVGNSLTGVAINLSANNTVGGTSAAVRNVIADSGNSGVGINGTLSTANLVAGNDIGVAADGVTAGGNGNRGVDVENAPGNSVTGNVVSANTWEGVNIGSFDQTVTLGDKDFQSGDTPTSAVFFAAQADEPAPFRDKIDSSRNIDLMFNNVNTGAAGTLTISLYNVDNIGQNIVTGFTINGVDQGTSAFTAAPGGTVIVYQFPLDSAQLASDTVSVRLVLSIADPTSPAGIDFASVDNPQPDSGGTLVAGNRIGTDATGTIAVGNILSGVAIQNSPNNTIGGTNVAARNIISGNGNNGNDPRDGVTLVGTNTFGNVVEGNSIGTDLSGTTALKNYRDGVAIFSGPSVNTIGGSSTAGQGNLISGNAAVGVGISEATTTNNSVLGNRIGTDVSGLKPLGNGSGVDIFNSSSGNTIGDSGDGDGNVISANLGTGLSISGGAFINQVGNNDIGTDANGADPNGNMGNGSNGVAVFGGANSNTIGGLAGLLGNIISANKGAGVSLSDAGTNLNVVAGNRIGTDKTGEHALGNAFDGVAVFNGAAENTIGGVGGSLGNVISANGFSGVSIHDPFTDFNQAVGNVIGLDALGGKALGNKNWGVYIASDQGAVISRNVISGNAFDGITINSFAFGVSVTGNRIGTDITGSQVSDVLGNSLGNGGSGIAINSGGVANTIGGVTATPGTAPGNVISGNHGAGILDSDKSAGSNFVAGNIIGLDASGTKTLDSNSFTFGNGGWGVIVADAPSNTIGGPAVGDGTFPRNVISNNRQGGVAIYGANALSDIVQGNLIGTGIGGSLAFGNAFSGVYVGDGGGFGPSFSGSAGSALIGGAGSAGNVLSANGGYGVVVEGGDTTSSGKPPTISKNNTIQGNVIGLRADESAALGNTDGGIGLFDAQLTTVSTNVIAGNTGNGVDIAGVDSSANTLVGNFVGTNESGASGLGNAQGVFIGDAANVPTTFSLGTAHDNTIGGTDPSALNIIAGNHADGVLIASASGGSGAKANVVEGNYVGTFDGTTALPNAFQGVALDGAPNNTVGGTAAGAGNVISGNALNGVIAIGSASTADLIAGNLIGTDFNGTAALANGHSGVWIGDASFFVAGSVGVASSITVQSNTISANTRDGILLQGTTDGKTATSGNLIAGNFIGTDSTGDALGNGFDGIYADQASSNTVGGTAAAARNVVSDNGLLAAAGDDSDMVGIFFKDSSSTANVVEGNYVGTRPNGATALGNLNDGVRLANGASNNTVGGSTATPGTAPGNLISGNKGFGVAIDSSNGNFVEGNAIGTDSTGMTAVANAGWGVGMIGGSSNNIVGGPTATPGTGLGNLISGNLNFGVGMSFAGTEHNAVEGNLIGTQIGGAGAIPNNIGVSIFFNASNNSIGGATTTDRNVISGNTGDGVQIDGAATNLVAANYIGVDVTGAAVDANHFAGVELVNGATGNTIGGLLAAEANVISGNFYRGVQIFKSGTTGNLVEGNRIGTNAAGNTALPNRYQGVGLNAAVANTIGGSVAGAGNLISGNGFDPNAVNMPSSGIVAEVGASANLVQGNLIGTDVTGTMPIPNAAHGILIRLAATNNTVGGTTSLTRNVISGNTADGVHIQDAGTLGNLVGGNWIGLDSGGANAVPNGKNGVAIVGAATANTIGAVAALTTGNIISGNLSNGVFISDTGTANNLVVGNGIGTDYKESSPVSNTANGVSIAGGATNNTVGGGNVIGGNTANGVLISGAGTASNLVAGNTIGTNTADAANLGNGADGVVISGAATGNTVGGTTGAARNIISGNVHNGVGISGSGTTGNVVEGDSIGTNNAGSAPLANGGDGVLVAASATGDTVGGTAAGAGNVISGNTGDGIAISGGSQAITIQGNLIGPDSTGSTSVPNLGSGVHVTAASNFTIGGTAAGARNIISGNGDVAHPIAYGVLIDGGSSGIAVQGNYIGLKASGSAVLGNKRTGVAIVHAPGNTVGGSVAGAGNVIAGNGEAGVYIQWSDSTGNLVQGNLIGTDSTGGIALGGNPLAGVVIDGAPQNTVGGFTAAARNIISGNAGDGVLIQDFFGTGTADGNVVNNNYIGLDSTGATALGNTGNGVRIATVASGTAKGAFNNTIGGAGSGDGNVISANGLSGVLISGAGTTGNVLERNLIGSDATGLHNRGNTLDGVRIANTASNNLVGGITGVSGVSPGNLIAWNKGNGVTVGLSLVDAAIEDGILGNSIFLNKLIGIDLGNDGVTPNQGPVSGAPNNLQNHPVLSVAKSNSTTTTITGTLAVSTGLGAATAFRVEFFANPSGSSQGRTFLGFTTVTIPASSTVPVAFTFTSPTLLAPGVVVTSTATDPLNNTSEFSAGQTVVQVPDDVSASVHIARGGFLFNRRTHLFSQVVTLKNIGTTTISGEISLVLDNLSSNATLTNKTGNTSALNPPAGSPYIDASVTTLAPGASTTITLLFADPSAAAITYGTRVLAGPGAR